MSNPASTPAPVCYHCKRPIPQGRQLVAHVAGKQLPVCSTECQKTVDWIERTGLSDFYRLRTTASDRPAHNDSGKQVWDSQALQSHVIKDKGDHKYEVCLLVDGMHCSGCVWLIERALLKLGGVSDIQINPVTHRARMVFDQQRVQLSQILETLQNAGYQPRPLETSALDDSKNQESRDLLKRLIVAAFGMMQVMTYAFVLYMGSIEELPKGTSEFFRWLGFLVSTPVVFYSALPFFSSARRAIKFKALNMDVPIAIAIAAVYSTSVYQALLSQGEVYFESVTMLVFFLLAGRYLEMRARHHSVDNADALIRLTPAFAQRRKSDGQLEKVPVIELQPGDRVHVPEGAHIPADGILLTQSTQLDESLLSGEANATQRLQDEAVIAGSLVLSNPIDIKVTHVGSETFLSKLTDLSTKAQTQRPKLTRQSEKATARFVFRVLVITSITLAGWLWYDSSRALEATIALLVVACPCALGLAAPAAITRALGVLAKRNVLVIQPDALEDLSRVDTAFFDKTGTLTRPAIKTGQVDQQTLQLAASLARESQHPLSKALVASTQQPLLAVEDIQFFSGLGLEGKINGDTLRLGQAKFALAEQPLTEELVNSSLVLSKNNELLATFDLDETLRADALSTINVLRADHVTCAILSGDSNNRVAQVAQKLGLDQWHGRQLPQDKLDKIQALHQQGQRVLVVGDGSNDAPLLAGADVSIALTSGAELAQANADILLCNGQLRGILDIRNVASQTRRILRQNERWAIVYNTTAMPLAALGFIPPWLAAICMSLSSLTVVLNALRIHNKTQENTQAMHKACATEAK